MIHFHGVSFRYGPSAVTTRHEAVLADLDLQIPAGLTLVLGPNGCGKSTLLKLAAGVERPDRGTVEILGFDLWRHEVAARRELVYIPEHPEVSPYATIGEVVALACRLRGLDVREGSHALETVGLAGLERRTVRELSQGQRRKALWAAALVANPRVALLDEPLEALDRAAQEGMVEWVAGLVEKGAAVVVVTHELAPFAPFATRALTVAGGRALVTVELPDAPPERLATFERLARGHEANRPF